MRGTARARARARAELLIAARPVKMSGNAALSHHGPTLSSLKLRGIAAALLDREKHLFRASAVLRTD